MAHRLAYLLKVGSWPADEIDHKNRVKRDNRWDNLREATPSQNQANIGLRSDSSTGFKGVNFNKQKKKFQAIVVKNGWRYHAGFHETAENAHQSYVALAKRLHGEFHSDGF
jgi:hypothetical protein